MAELNIDVLEFEDFGQVNSRMKVSKSETEVEVELETDDSSGPNCCCSLFSYVRFTWQITLLILYAPWVFLVKICRAIIPQAAKRLNGEIILVTGGGNGIGRAICHELVNKEPCLTIIIWDVDEMRGRDTVNELKARGVYAAHFYLVDVADRLQVENGAKIIRDKIGDVTMLFNNAGIANQVGEGWLLDPERIEKVFQVNLISHCWTLREFLAPMIEKGSGHVIETCSMLALINLRYSSPYTASKHGLEAYINCIKEDMRILPQKPKVNFTIVYPNMTATDLIKPAGARSKRYPFIMNTASPESVAKKIIKGVRRNEQYIYFPGVGSFFRIFLALIPTEIIQKAQDSFKLKYNRSV